MAKYRGAKSYYGRTEQAKENQRKNLVPGGPWQKKMIEILRLKCFWNVGDLESRQFIYEGYINKRDIKDIPQEELEDEEFLNAWWDELKFEERKNIYKAIMDPLTKEEKAPILKLVQKCLEGETGLNGKELNNYVK